MRHEKTFILLNNNTLYGQIVEKIYFSTSGSKNGYVCTACRKKNLFYYLAIKWILLSRVGQTNLFFDPLIKKIVASRKDIYFTQ